MILTEEIKNKCLEDVELFYKVAKSLNNKTPNAMVRMLERNSSPQLQGYKFIKVIEKHTGLNQNKILAK